MALLYTFDPDGDLLLILSASSEKTALPPQPEDTTSDAADTKDETSPVPPEAPQTNNETVHLLVSSKHMSLASPVFKVMLGENFREGQALRADGKVEILLDDDPAAFIILANVVHGKLSSVPSRVDVDVLFSLAIVADKYQMHEVTKFFCQAWFRELENDVPIDYAKPAYVMKWLAVAYVFQNAKTFKHLTHLIARRGTDRLEDDVQEGMPLPDSIIRDIKLCRQQALSALYSAVEEIIRKCQQSRKLCAISSKEHKEACESMILGTFTRSMVRAGIWPAPESPYNGIRFETSLNLIHAAKVFMLCNAVSNGNGIYSFSKRPKQLTNKSAHSFPALMQAELKSVVERNLGLCIDKYPKPSLKRKFEE